MVVYAEALFGVNAGMNLLTLLAAARLGGAAVCRRRLMVAAAVGGLYAVAAVRWTGLTCLPVKLLVGILLCRIAFAKTGAWQRLTLLFAVVACGFAGAVLLAAVAAQKLQLIPQGLLVPSRTLWGGAALAFALCGLALRGDRMQGVIQRRTELITVTLDGRTRTFTILHDTGNELVEPFSGKPVLLLGWNAVQALCGDALSGLTTENAAACLAQLPPAWRSRAGLLPYQTIGLTHGLLLYVRPDTALDAKGRNLPCVVGLTAQRFTGYDGLIGG